MTAPQVYEAISSVMAVMSKEGIAKDRRNQQQGYSFRGIDDVYNALGSVLAENKLMMLPRVVDQKREERATAKGGVLIYTILTVEFDMVCALDGSMHTVRMVGEAMDSADKSGNKAQSAALKYAALQVFMIPTEGDNDADAQTHEVAPKPPQKPVQPKQEKPNAETPFDEPAAPAGDPDAVVDDLCERIRVCKTPDDLESLRSAPEFTAAYGSLPGTHKAMVRQAKAAREQGIAAGN